LAPARGSHAQTDIHSEHAGAGSRPGSNRRRGTDGLGRKFHAYQGEFAHLPVAFTRSDVDLEHADWLAVGWVAIALASLMASVAFGGGFILGSTLLFVFTARAFGRRALVIDLAIGLVLAILVFLLFNKLLSLTLPMGPLEQLF
jgi:hypothetical protein